MGRLSKEGAQRQSLLSMEGGCGWDSGERVNDERSQWREVLEAGNLRTRNRASSALKKLTRRRCRREDQSDGVPGPGLRESWLPLVSSHRTPHRWRLWVPAHPGNPPHFSKSGFWSLHQEKEQKSNVTFLQFFVMRTETSTISCFRNAPQANRLHTAYGLPDCASLRLRACPC